MQKEVQHSPELRTLPLFIFSRMDSSDRNPGLLYKSSSTTTRDSDSERSSSFLGILHVFVHHARNIHNICIYENQDVYAKFVLTYNPDEAVSTRVIMRGGKNPDFNESITMRIDHSDAVLKCEIWMLSRARNYMEDQLLGFALVPVSSVVSKGKVTQEFSLSSTDLFHSPAGTVKLSLSLDTSPRPNYSISSFPVSPPTSSISSEVVLVDRSTPILTADTTEYTSIEFPDINLVKQNQQMVSEYFHLASQSSDPKHELVSTASFLCLGASSQPIEDCEMVLNPNVGKQVHGSMATSGSSHEDKNTQSVKASNNDSVAAQLTTSIETIGNTCLHHQPNSSDLQSALTHNDIYRGKQIIHSTKDNKSYVKNDTPFSTANANIEAEQSAMQQHIVDMYMRSMQQFTESLAKMKLPMNLGTSEHEAHGEIIQNPTSSNEMESNKKDGSRVFYGSRAFF